MAQRILRPLAYGDLLDELFDLYKKNFMLFVGISGMVYVPMAILMTVAMAPMYSMMGDLSKGAPPSDPSMFFAKMIPSYIAMFGIGTFGGIMQVIAMGATTWAVSSCYLGKKPTILESYKAVLPKVGPFIVTFILMYIALMIGLVLCVLPGIFVAVVLAFVPQVIILEDLKYTDAIKRSYQLALPHWGRIFVTALISMIVIWTASALISAPIQIATVIFKENISWIYMLSQLVQGLTGAITTPVMVIVLVLMYYDIRVRQEGFDVEMLAASIGSSPAPPTTPDQV